EQARRTTDVTVIGVSSAASGDGKTLTAINLAGALAQARGTRVLLMDLDLRNPGIADELALDTSEPDVLGLLLNPQLTLAEAVRPCPPSALAVLPSGGAVNATYELLKSERCGQIIAAARKAYEYVVVDLPPLIPIADCRLVEKWLDAFLIVVAAHRTPRKMLEEGLATIDTGKVLGLVFNRDDGPMRSYAYGALETRDAWWRRLFGLDHRRPVRRRLTARHGPPTPSDGRPARSR